MARTALAHFREQYALKLVALFLTLLTLYLAFSILFSTSSWFSDELLTIFLLLSILALLFSLLKLFRLHYPSHP